jgi:hypothetical protein
MKRIVLQWTAAVALGAGVLLAPTPGGASLAQIETLAANLTHGGSSYVNALACPGSTTCVAGGWVASSPKRIDAFVATEKSGVWMSARLVAAPLNRGGLARLNAVACPAPGYCVVVGSFRDAQRHTQAFWDEESDGTWLPAREGAAALNAGGNASAWSVSCPVAMDCTIAGWYTNSSGTDEGFVQSEVHGTWNPATAISANQGPDVGAQLTDVACASPVTCVAVGTALPSDGSLQAFAVQDSGAGWGASVSVAPRDTSFSSPTALACPSTTSCVVGGSYADPAGGFGSFVTSLGPTGWATPDILAGTLNVGDNSTVQGLWCDDTGDCVAAGDYTNARGATQPYVDTLSSDGWASAVAVASHPDGTLGFSVNSLDCADIGHCVIGGSFSTSRVEIAGTITSDQGLWGRSLEVDQSLNTGGFGEIDTVACWQSGACATGGVYSDRSHESHGFVQQ